MSFRRTTKIASFVIFFALLVFANSSRMSSAADVSDPPSIRQWVSPSFASVVLDADAFGPVVVDLELDATGNVVSVKTVEGHSQLRSATEFAVRQWKFATAAEQNRILRITFNYSRILEQGTEGPIVLPYRIKIPIERPVTIDMVPADWVPGSKRCELHGDSFVRGRVEMGYGMTWPRRLDLEAKARFPHANSSYQNGCTMLIDEKTNEFSPKYAEVLYCPTCRALEDAWFREHPLK